MPKYPLLLVWHYWISLLRIPSVLAGLGVLLYLFIDPLLGAWYYYRSNGIHVQWVFTMVTWMLLLLNDLFILTIDMKRAYPYLCGIGIQSTLSLVSLILSTISSVPLMKAGLALFLGTDAGNWTLMILPGIPATTCCILSACCLGLVIWPVISLRNRYKMTWAQVWKCNTKDAFILHAGQSNQDHARGTCRQIQKGVISNRQMICIPVNGLRRYFIRSLFRRIHPVEKKSYAFARNIFAVLAMGLLVFRAITALFQTNSKINTRVYSKYCRSVNYREHDVQVLVVSRFSGNDMSLTQRDSLRLVGSVGKLEDERRIQTQIWIETSQGEAKPCEKTERNEYGSRWYPSALYSYTCSYITLSDWSFKPYTYLIAANSSNKSPLNYEDMPLVWLANEKENIQGKGVLSPFYSTPWRPLPGYHSELEAGLVSRGFISSPIMHDLILNTDPEYTYISLYPIATLAAVPLTNSTIATARLHITMNPGLKYFRDREPFDKVNAQLPYQVMGWADFKTCDFIEDYRSGTILDVLGSVGGLFAILQTIHLLLFGRPLLWGLSGTKLINPFGLVGAFDSNDFRRRLHETYGRKPTEDNPDPIQTAAFLRDFVIDFGPLGTEASQDQKPTTLRPTPDRHETLNSAVPLMPLHREDTMDDELEHETNLKWSPIGADID